LPALRRVCAREDGRPAARTTDVRAAAERMKTEEKDAQGADGGPGRVSAMRSGGGSCALTCWNVRAPAGKRGHGTRRTAAGPLARPAPRPACPQKPRGARRAAITGPTQNA